VAWASGAVIAIGGAAAANGASEITVTYNQPLPAAAPPGGLIETSRSGTGLAAAGRAAAAIRTAVVPARPGELRKTPAVAPPPMAITAPEAQATALHEMLRKVTLPIRIARLTLIDY
jgi:hypothetical protein